jgi:AraC family ethanolamine operon transcriptional activator
LEKASMSTGNNGRIATHRLVADSVDTYSAALPGFTLDVVRTGAGFGPNFARATVTDDVMLASCVTGFPILGRTTVANDRVVVGLLTSTPPGSRWCEIDLEPGVMLLYGPGTEHTAVDPAGLGYIALSVTVDHLAAVGEAAELVLPNPRPGHVEIMRPTHRTVHLAGVLGSVSDPRTDTNDERLLDRGDAVHALATALSDISSARDGGDRPGGTNSRRITSACIEHADMVGGIPSIAHLCGVAHVSERRLRKAFVDTFGVPPSQYFRLRGLKRVRKQLTSQRTGLTVGATALDAGFGNLGRFAHEYARVFGELPSETLRRA